MWAIRGPLSRNQYWLFAALMIPVAIWLARLPSPDGPVAGGTSTDPRGIVRRHAWLVGLIAAFFFLHMGGEMAFGGWIFSYADDATGSQTTARLVNSAFWGGLGKAFLAGVTAESMARTLLPSTGKSAARLSPRAAASLARYSEVRQRRCNSSKKASCSNGAEATAKATARATS